VYKTRKDNYTPCPHYRRVNPSLLQRLRQSNTQALIADGCSNMRNLCSSIQNITAEVNNLLTSIENFMPLVNTYLTATQARETISVAPSSTASYSAANKIPTETVGITQNQNIKQPKPEDIQQLLENPLVKNLLSNFVQNTAGQKT